MQHTLVAVFDNRTDAQSAMDELLASGFSRQEVRLSEGADADADVLGGSSTTTRTGASASNDGSITGSIKHFFSDLLLFAQFLLEARQFRQALRHHAEGMFGLGHGVRAH